jgi:hypothetical protein
MSRQTGEPVGKWAAVHLLVETMPLAVGIRYMFWHLGGGPCQVVVVGALVSGQVGWVKVILAVVYGRASWEWWLVAAFWKSRVIERSQCLAAHSCSPCICLAYSRSMHLHSHRVKRVSVIQVGGLAEGQMEGQMSNCPDQSACQGWQQSEPCLVVPWFVAGLWWWVEGVLVVVLAW